MAYEYLVVLFPRKREVLINGEFMGFTNRRLELEGGHYRVALGPPPNFVPEEQEVELINTTIISPKIIQFEES